VTTPPTTFEDSYRRGEPPWVIDQPQPAVVDLERAGALTGPVLDLGCGTGEHTVLLARLGYAVLGADAAPAAIERARERARARGSPPSSPSRTRWTPRRSDGSPPCSTAPSSMSSAPTTAPATPGH
jgi:SAM-dependent methyltransferase